MPSPTVTIDSFFPLVLVDSHWATAFCYQCFSAKWTTIRNANSSKQAEGRWLQVHVQYCFLKSQEKILCDQYMCNQIMNRITSSNSIVLV